MILLYILGAVTFFNCIYYFIFSTFSFGKFPQQKKIVTTAVTLLICSKNEAKNLQLNIPKWLSQTHPSFELILINDASSDETLDVMESFQKQDPRIKIVNVENNEAFWGSKKYALTLGIKKATHERLVFSDADCTPASNEWLEIMSSHFSEQKQLILGYGGYKKQRGLLNALIRFETLLTAIQYFSYSKIRIPYMGVGRNLAYTTTLFYAQKGFISHMKIKSGDDDLFVNEAATKDNIALCIDANAHTYSTPKKTWKDWFYQKRRHTTTASHYKPFHKFLLGFYFIMNLFFWGIASIVLASNYWKTGLIIITIRLLLQYSIIAKAAYKLKEQNLIPFFLFLDLFLIASQICIFISNLVSKPRQWK